MSDEPTTTVVIGVGNPFRHDDGAGPAVVEALRNRSADLPAGTVLATTDGEPTRLLDLWTGADLAVVVDAISSDPVGPGRVYELKVDAVAPPGSAASSHGVGLGTAVELGTVLDRMPRHLVVYAVTGEDFSIGAGLSEAVLAAVERLTDRVLAACVSEAEPRRR